MVSEADECGAPDPSWETCPGESCSTMVPAFLARTDARTAVRLAVIVPTYGNWADTLECLRLLGEQNAADFHVILADDGSPEPPPREVGAFSFVMYIRFPHAGFAAVCNAAASAAGAAGYTHLLLLNNDTQFGREFIRVWLGKIQELPQAILGPMIYEYDAPATVWYTGGSRSIAVPFMRLRRVFATQSAVDVLTACVLVIPVHVWRHLNGFEKRFVTYYEDFDFVLRAREQGVSAYVVVEPELRVLHKVSRTALRNGLWPREYRMLASRLLFIRRRYRGATKAFCLLLVIPHLVLLGATHLPELPSPTLLWKAIREGLRGMR